MNGADPGWLRDRGVGGGHRAGGRSRRGFLVGFAVLFAAWLVFGLVDSLVWLPQATAPSIPLRQIYGVLSEAGSAPGVTVAPVLWFLFWAAAGTAYVMVLSPARRAFRPVAESTPLMSVIGIGLLLTGGMAFFQSWSGFGMGMEVSDDLPPGVGISTPFEVFCFISGAAIAVLGGLFCAVGAVRAAHHRRPAARR